MTQLIVVQGAPAVGKTILSRQLAAELQIGILAKDDFKELLYDKLGIPIDRDQSRVYGKAVMGAMFQMSRTLLEGQVSHIFESAFHPDLANNDFVKLLSRLEGVRVVQLFCHTTPEVQLGRYMKRLQSGGRHPGHPDRPKDISDFVEYNQIYTRLALEPCIDVDTSKFGKDEFNGLVDNIKQVLDSSDV